MRQVARKSVGLARAEKWVMGRLTHQRDISEVSNDGRPHVTGGEQDRASYNEDSDEDMPSLEAADEDRFSPHSPHEDGFSSYSPHDDGFSPHSPPLSPLSPREHSHHTLLASSLRLTHLMSSPHHQVTKTGTRPSHTR